MARPNGKDGASSGEKAEGWWVGLYLNGKERWFRCDTKSQARVLYGRLKGEQREGRYFDKKAESELHFVK